MVETIGVSWTYEIDRCRYCDTPLLDNHEFIKPQWAHPWCSDRDGHRRKKSDLLEMETIAQFAGLKVVR